MLKIHILIIILINKTFCEDIFYNLNNVNVVHKVSEKFLSISIDPAVLLAGVNLSDTSLLLARNLSPAFIRLAGPSTAFVKYVDNEEDLILRKPEEGTNVIITPTMWFGINEWLNLANLIPVFGINDNETDKGVWDPKSTLPLLEMSDKFDVNCYWQLGYDCSNKTLVRYVEDLNILRQTLNGFREHKSFWKIVGSDLSRCMLDKFDNQNLEHYVNDLDENVDVVMWESPLVSKAELGFTKSALWTSVPKDTKPVTFLSAMEWARQVGETAKMEYDVIFRQPRLLEMTHDTSIYWFSVLYKKLMGTNVLEITPTNPNSDLSTFAHCTKRQNNFARTGAVTVMMINNGSEAHIANIRLGNFMLDQSMEVQSYFLTASDETSTEVYLNDKKLIMDMLKNADDIWNPKLRRAKIKGYISLEIPPLTIGFFVLTGAKNALCSNNEENLNAILEEINGDQDLSLSEEAQFKLEERWKNGKKGDVSNSVGEKITLETIKKNILKEMDLDKNYYMLKKQKTNNDNLVQQNLKDAVDVDSKKEMLHKHLRAFIEKAKKSDVSKDSGTTRQKEKNIRPASSPSNLHFTIKEIQDILKRRAKAKAEAKNIKLTSSELDLLVEKATVRLPKHFVSKRDINSFLLEEKANFHKNNMFSQEEYERYAKEHKLLPMHKLSKITNSRIRRNINQSLLNMKAKLEEHKKYMLQRNSHLRNSHSHKHKSLLHRSKRDINLDLLKTRTRPISLDRKNKIAVQPSFKDSRKYFYDSEEKQSTKVIPAFSSDELFKDFLESEEYITKDDKMPRKPANYDMDMSKYEHYFKDSKNSHKINPFTIFSKPNLDVALPRKSTPKKKNKSPKFDSDELLNISDEFDDFDEKFRSCSHEWGFSSENSKKTQNHGLTRMWNLRSSGKDKKDESAAVDLDDVNYFDDLIDEYGYIRKKRETNSIVKEKLKSLKKGIKSKVEKLKMKTVDDRAKYLKEKIKNKIELIKKQNIEKLKEKGLISNVKNIQIVPRIKSKHENNTSENNTISYNKNSSEKNLENNKVKRSLLNNDLSGLFGQYQPLTPSLTPWKPADILGLQKNYFGNLPLYNWLQEQNLRNTLLQTKYLFGLRKRRYIENGSVNSVENEILNDEDQRNKVENDKYSKANLLQKENLLNNNSTHIEKITTLTSPKGVIEKKSKNKTIESIFDKTVEKEILGNENQKDKNENDKTEFVKYSKGNLLHKENLLNNNITHVEKINKPDVIELTSPKEEKSKNKTIAPIPDKTVSAEKLTYLEKILGKQKVKPLEDFVKMVKDSFSSMNNKVVGFFRNIF